mgnify:CR=1 FL=1
MQNEPFEASQIIDLHNQISSKLQIDEKEIAYFVFHNQVENQAYNQSKPIKILYSKGKTEDIAQASDQLNLQALTEPVVKYYVCYPKKMILEDS